MYKGIFILYLVCFGCYILFTRQPDYFDGEKAPAAIQYVADSATGKMVHIARFSNGYRTYTINADYYFRSLETGDKVTVIYELDHPERAVVYTFWGYWIGLGELIGSVVFLVLSFQVALAITKNPTPESLIEQLDYKDPVKPKYD